MSSESFAVPKQRTKPPPHQEHAAHESEVAVLITHRQQTKLNNATANQDAVSALMTLLLAHELAHTSSKQDFHLC